MSRLFRITLRKMLSVLRLVIVVSLAGYSVSFASAAMHGNDRSEVSLDAQSHVHEVEKTQDHTLGNLSVANDDGSVKRDCCKDFCASSAIIAMTEALQDRDFLTSRQFLNDQKLTGNVLAIDLPPNIYS